MCYKHFVQQIVEPFFLIRSICSSDLFVLHFAERKNILAIWTWKNIFNKWKMKFVTFVATFISTVLNVIKPI